VNVNSVLPINIVASTPSLCAGFTVGLLATGAPGTYTWMPGGSTNNPFIDTPTVTTTYTVLGGSPSCPSSATITIVVVPLPTIVLSANPQTVCPGQTTTLTASGGVTYSWIPSLQGGNTFTDNPTATKEYTVVGFDAAGCPGADTIDVFVTSPPNIVIASSSASVCPGGGSATLTAVGATNYTWQPGNMSGNVVVVSPTAPTVYTVTGDNGACTGSAVISIGISPAPVISGVASTPTICPGATVQLIGNGGVNYTWTPPGTTGAVITDSPIVSTTYTVVGADINGCTGANTVFVFVRPMNVTIVATPSNICSGDSSTLIATGGLTFTWNPGGQTTNSVVVNPIVNTTYTVMIDDGSCLGTFTLAVNVFQTPTVSISPTSPTICSGSSVTLTASGATSYTWLPSGTVSSVTVENPLSFTTYTVTGSNGGVCFGTATVDVFVNPPPKNVTASSTGTVSCTSPTAQLFGQSTSTNISYLWNGPQSYTSNVQNPVVSGVWGNFTLTVTDNVTGCSATATVDIPSDNSIPSVTATASGDITCSNVMVNLNAANTTTNPAYSWIGPAGFTSTLQTPTVSVGGTYTIVVTDLSSTCTGSAVVTVITHTRVTSTASISPATCNDSGLSNNDGTIAVFGFTVGGKYDLVSGTSYTGSATYATAANIPTNGIITSNLANPTTTLAYTIRLFDAQECHLDTTLYLVPVDCVKRSLGIAKAVSVPYVNSDGSYNVTYTVVVKNYGQGVLQNISLTENLAATFPAPSSFTVLTDSTYLSAGSGLSLNKTGFDGLAQTNLLTTGSNFIAPGQVPDTIRFTIKVRPAVFFTEYKNTVLGLAMDQNNSTLVDSSNTGLDPDPDQDGNPSNNNTRTSVIFIPNNQLEITKTGEIHQSDDQSYDVTYTITVYNTGNDTLRNVSLKDSLFGMAIQNPATYSMRSGPTSSGSELVVNSTYDGNTQSSLLIPEQSKLPPNTSRSVYFTINVVPGAITSIANSANGSALAALSLTETIVLYDTSGVTLEIPGITHPLFIPEGFSPNGDNNNDYFVIQGLPETGENPIVIFNRWGNKVYQHANYDNTWNGFPNVSGTLGKNKLPPGTYYYILEMKGSGQKPITGFVVLQY
jgi:gliding motility-associated-like protein